MSQRGKVRFRHAASPAKRFLQRGKKREKTSSLTYPTGTFFCCLLEEGGDAEACFLPFSHVIPDLSVREGMSTRRQGGLSSPPLFFFLASRRDPGDMHEIGRGFQGIQLISLGFFRCRSLPRRSPVDPAMAWHPAMTVVAMAINIQMNLCSQFM